MKCEVCTIGNRRQQLIRYNLAIDDRLVVVENVPAAVCDNCGEISIQPEVASQLQKTIWERKTPARTIEAAVYEFSR
jgi:HTH-type transcriptional regulator / antitoxin MqsA